MYGVHPRIAGTAIAGSMSPGPAFLHSGISRRLSQCRKWYERSIMVRSAVRRGRLCLYSVEGRNCRQCRRGSAGLWCLDIHSFVLRDSSVEGAISK
jgi:hypothetical protein